MPRQKFLSTTQKINKIPHSRFFQLICWSTESVLLGGLIKMPHLGKVKLKIVEEERFKIHPGKQKYTIATPFYLVF